MISLSTFLYFEGLNFLLFKDTCSLYPHRKLWAAKKCGVLKSNLFKPCHSEVPLQRW